MSILFSPITIGQVQIKNRIVVSPMCQYSSQDGFSNDWHLVHLGSRAVGGAGLIITEAAAVSPEGRISPDDLGIWTDEHIAGLKRITQFIDAQSSVAGIQLAHAGRKASTKRPWEGGGVIPASSERGWRTAAPSAVPFYPDSELEVLTIDGIRKVIDDFREATRRSREAGFRVVEIHAAHGYLIHQFMSPLSNQRTDEYGGSFENRIRLLLEIVDAVKTVWPADLPLFVRISTTDWTEGGWDGNDSVKLARILKDKGVHVIDCSTGGNVPHAKIPVEPNYQVPNAERIKQETGMLTGAVGLITTAEQAEEILNNGQADLILMARELLRDPYFPLHAAITLGDDLAWPLQYERAKPR
jgi:2,4-dienoyl-CoA reductase-like NADH-dependent reductase (Old Yellow Enzyme family)